MLMGVCSGGLFIAGGNCCRVTGLLAGVGLLGTVASDPDRIVFLVLVNMILDLLLKKKVPSPGLVMGNRIDPMHRFEWLLWEISAGHSCVTCIA